MFSRRIVRILLTVGLALAGVARPPAAFAQPADVTDKVTQLNREALAAIDKREFEKARELLKRALDMCNGAGLDQHPVAARTHIHMGVVIIQGFKNPELGKKQFALALAIDPNMTITKSLSTPDLEEAFAEVKALGPVSAAPSDGAGTRAPPPPPAAPPAESAARTPAPPSSGFSYHTVSEVKQGSSIVVTVTVDESLKFTKLVLAYREQGTSEFLGREMEAVGDGAYRAEIPASATNGSSVAYYMEAQDADGNPVASRGTESRPLVIAFAATARPAAGRAEASVERKAEIRKHEDGEENEDEWTGKIFASLLVGSGVGYTSGKGEVNADVPVSGTASGALLGHIAPEVGYWLRPDLMLSLQGRFQLVTGTTELDKAGKTYSPVPAALAVFAKASWFTNVTGSLRPFVSGGLGGGQIRHVVTFGNLTDCGSTSNQKCVDSVVAGPLLAEVGGGVFYKLTSAVALVLSSNAEVAAPKFTLNLDINGGIGFAF
jgi:hypothetical protein